MLERRISAMKVLRWVNRHAGAAVLAIGAATIAGDLAWSLLSESEPTTAFGPGDVALTVAFGAFTLTPFLGLAAATRRLSAWAALPTAIAFSVATIEAGREARESLSSTGSAILVFLPPLLVLCIPLVLALEECVRLAVRLCAGARPARPGRRDVALALTLAGAGLLVLGPAGMVAGLALGFALWARRSTGAGANAGS